VHIGDLVKCLAPQTPDAFGVVVKEINHVKFPDGFRCWSVWVHGWSGAKGKPLPYEHNQLEVISESR
jgi:hypothetical protein